MNEDMRSGGAAAHKAVKGASGVSSDPKQVHEAFTEEWSEKVFRLQRQKPDWKEFQKEYDQYVPRVPYTQGTINGEDMFKTVQGMGKTVPVLDGWRIHELKALGLEAWIHRARIV